MKKHFKVLFPASGLFLYQTYCLLTITFRNIWHSGSCVAQCLIQKDTHLSGSFGILNKEIPGVFLALLSHHRAMQYVPPAFDLLQLRFTGEGVLTVFLLRFLLLLLFIQVLVINDLVGMEISALNKHSTFRPSHAVLMTLSGRTSPPLMVPDTCFHFGCVESELPLLQDIPAILSFVFLWKWTDNFKFIFYSTTMTHWNITSYVLHYSHLKIQFASCFVALMTSSQLIHEVLTWK